MRSKSVFLGLAIASFAATMSVSANSPALANAYARLPMSFEKNDAQSDSRADFIARGSGYSAFLSSSEVVLAVKKQAGGGTIHMTLVGSTAARAAGEDELPGKVNYFVGNDPAKWRRDVPTFAKVRYTAVYPGIDVVYYGNQSRLEYDFVVAPGADPKAITLDFRGGKVDIDDEGKLVLALADGSLSMLRPYSYQEIDGVRQHVAGDYVKSPDGRIGFTVGDYDRTRPLVIDPVLLYATYIGGAVNDAVNAIAVDKSGNAYITGQTNSNDFPTQSAAQAISGAGSDAFIAKIDASGTSLVYSTYFGGNGEDVGGGIAVDASGQVYVAGRTDSNNFPTTSGAYQATYNGGTDGFVAKLNASGSALIYSTFLGGDGYDAAKAIAIDGSDNAYITGDFYISTFPTTLGAYQSVNKGAFDAFVSKLNASGSALLYSTYLGGISDEDALGIAVDAQGNSYVTGSTGSNNFPILNAAQGTFGGHYDAFITKLNPNGSALIYSTYAGGLLFERGSGIAVDPLGNAYAAGQTASSNFPATTGAYQTANAGYEDAFVVKLNPNGGAFAYATYLGGAGVDAANAVAVDASGSAYVTGTNYQGGFPLKDPLQSTYHTDSFEAFAAKFQPNGVLEYSTYLGGAGNDVGLAIAVDSLGTAYVAGSTQSTDFPITVGSYQEANGGIYDGFIAKIAAASVGKITGGGSIAVGGDIGTFGFTVQRATANAPIKGDLQYVDHSTGTKVRSVSFSSFSVAQTTATFAGTCVSNGVACTFVVQVTDNGEPGSNDAFSISVSGAATQGGTLRSGNIQIH